MNGEGEEKAGEFNEKVFKQYNLFINLTSIKYEEDKEISLMEKIVTNPLYFYGSKTYSAIDYLDISDGDSLYDNDKTFALKRADRSPFNFEDCLTNVEDEKKKKIGKDVLENYKALNDFIEKNLGNYVTRTRLFRKSQIVGHFPITFQRFISFSIKTRLSNKFDRLDIINEQDFFENIVI